MFSLEPAQKHLGKFIMESLNEDCVLKICSYLNLRDQISLQQVCSHLTQIIKRHWISKYKHCECHFLKQHLSSSELQNLLAAICETVEIIEFRFFNKLQYETLKKFTYTKAWNFRFTQLSPYFMNDNDIKDLADIFPNLRSFSPHGYFTGEHIKSWSTLTDLSLSYCYKLNPLTFLDIMNNLKLEKLQLNIFPNYKAPDIFNGLDLQTSHVKYLTHLQLNTYEFYYFVCERLPALKQLILTNHYNPQQIFDVLLSKWKCSEIMALETSNINHILINCLNLNMNIEKLIIINDVNALPLNAIDSLHQLTQLRELSLNACELDVAAIQQLLYSGCFHLELISIALCQLNEAFLKLNVRDIIINRNKNLRFNFYSNTLEKINDGELQTRNVVLELNGTHSLFEVTEIPTNKLLYEPLCVTFHSNQIN
uniref:F-box domain-containing protein n=1 Tax=Glossina brevipalpis TaxID=37001 RepID=A0A1A9W9X2_9MUSC